FLRRLRRRCRFQEAAADVQDCQATVLRGLAHPCASRLLYGCPDQHQRGSHRPTRQGHPWPLCVRRFRRRVRPAWYLPGRNFRPHRRISCGCATVVSTDLPTTAPAASAPRAGGPEPNAHSTYLELVRTIPPEVTVGAGVLLQVRVSGAARDL